MGFSARGFFSQAANLFSPTAKNSQSAPDKNSDDDPARGLERSRVSVSEDFQNQVAAEKAKPLPPIPKPELSIKQQQALERMKARMQRNREMDMGR